MRQYILRRLLSMVPVLIIVSMISFGLLYVLPGDPAVAMLGENVGTQETYRTLRRELGLDRPLWEQYGRWLGRVVQGDLGTSIRTSEPVAAVLLQRAPVSLYVGFAGLVVGILIGLPVAIVSALRPGSRLDVIGTVLALGGIAIPSFWQARPGSATCGSRWATSSCTSVSRTSRPSGARCASGSGGSTNRTMRES